MRNTNYQIDKCSVDKFFYRFHSRELFAGATIYSKNVVDFKKNHKKLISSETNWKKMAEYFSKQELKDIDENTEFNEHHKRIFKLIQKFSYHKIKAETLKSTKILNSLYKGIEEFDEPYCAHWLLINDSLTQKIPKDITVTKGSTHGGEIDPTVVFKPKLS
jgi:hypothetical protein